MLFLSRLSASAWQAFAYLETTWVLCVRVPKNILLENWRLAVVLRTIQLLSIAVFASVYFSEGILAAFTVNVTPRVTANFSIDDQALSVFNRSHVEGISQLCDPTFLPSVVYKHQELNHVRTMAPQGCVMPQQGEWWERGESTVFIPTFVTEELIEQRSGGDNCLLLQRSCNGTHQNFKLAIADARNGAEICRCTKKTEFFNRGVGGLKLQLDAHYELVTLYGDTAYGTTQDRNRTKIMLMEPKAIRRSEYVTSNTLKKTSLLQSSGGAMEDQDNMRSPQAKDAPTEKHVRHRLNHRVPGSFGHTALSVDSDAHLSQTFSTGNTPSRSLLDLHERSSEEVTSKHHTERRLPASHVGDAQGSGKMTPVEDEIDGKLIGYAFQNNEKIAMNLEDWLRHALLIDDQEINEPFRFKQYDDMQRLIDTGSLLDIPNYGVALNSSDDGSFYRPPFRMTGLELRIRVDVSNKAKKRRQLLKSMIWGEKISRDEVTINVEVIPGWHGQPRSFALEPRDPETGSAKVVTRQSQGIVIRIVAGGRFSYFSASSFFSMITSVIVCFQIPELLIGGIALYLMSQTSDFYYYVANERLRMKRSLVGFIARALGWFYLFSLEIKDDEESKKREENKMDDSEEATKQAPLLRRAKNNSITPEMLCADLNEALARKYNADDPFIRMLVHELAALNKSPDAAKCAVEPATEIKQEEKEKRVSARALTCAASCDDVFSVEEFESVYRDAPWSILEEIFLPHDERKV